METEQAARRWAAEWQRGWSEHDGDRIEALYAPGALFRSSPFRELDEPRRYVDWAFGDEDAAECWFGQPTVARDRATVEWWAVLRSGDQETTLAGVSLLRFDEAGLVVDQHDYWNELEGGRSPYPGWGR
jgi:hypothetical protein